MHGVAFSLLAAMLAFVAPPAARAEFTRADIPPSKDCRDLAKFLNDHIKIKDLSADVYHPVSTVDPGQYCKLSFASPIEHYANKRSACWNFLDELKRKVGRGPGEPGTLRATMQAACDSTKAYDDCRKLDNGARMQECVAKASAAVEKAEGEKAKVAREVAEIVTRFENYVDKATAALNAARARLRYLQDSDRAKKFADVGNEKFEAWHFGVGTLGEVQHILGIQRNGPPETWGRLVKENDAIRLTRGYTLGATNVIQRESEKTIREAHQAVFKATGRAAGLSTITDQKLRPQADHADDRPSPPYYPPQLPQAQGATAGGGSGPATTGSGATGGMPSREPPWQDQAKPDLAKADPQKANLGHDPADGSPPEGNGSSESKKPGANEEAKAKADGAPAATRNALEQRTIPFRATGPSLGRQRGDSARAAQAAVKGGALSTSGGGLGQSGGGDQGCSGPDCAAGSRGEGKVSEGGEAGHGGGVPGFEGGASSEKGEEAKVAGKATADRNSKESGGGELTPLFADAPMEKDLNKSFAALDAIFDQVVGKGDANSGDAAKGEAKGASAIDVKELVDDGDPILAVIATPEGKAKPAATKRRIAQATSVEVLEDNFDGDLGLDLSLFERVRGYLRANGQKRLQK